MTHPHLDGLIPEVPPLPKNPDSADCARRVGYAEAVDEMRRRVAALAALPGGGVDGSFRLLVAGEVIQRGDTVLGDDTVTWLPLSGWEVGMKYSPSAMVPARRFTPTPNPHEADRNG